MRARVVVVLVVMVLFSLFVYAYSNHKFYFQALSAVENESGQIDRILSDFKSQVPQVKWSEPKIDDLVISRGVQRKVVGKSITTNLVSRKEYLPISNYIMKLLHANWQLSDANSVANTSSLVEVYTSELDQDTLILAVKSTSTPIGIQVTVFAGDLKK